MADVILAIGLALFAAPLAGGFLRGIDRKLTARCQGRVGPPVLQPFYDFFKLLGKSRMVSSKANLVWAWSYLLFTVASVLLLALGEDLLVIFFILAFAGASLAFGAFAVRSPYSHFGANRELLQMFSYEPILLLAAVAIFLQTGSFKVSEVLTYSSPLLVSLPLAFLAVLIALGIKMRKSPFDLAASEHAHQEIVRGVYTEYSGPYLALIELAHWYELILVLGFIVLFWAQPLWLGAVIALGSFMLEILVDNITARMHWSWMVGVSWFLGVGLLLVNIIVVALGVYRPGI